MLSSSEVRKWPKYKIYSLGNEIGDAVSKMIKELDTISEETLAIVKPDAVEAGLYEEILVTVLTSGFTLTGAKRLTLSKAQAKKFYKEHDGKPFFDDLATFMSSGPSWFITLTYDRNPGQTVTKFRELLGSTNPSEASYGTLRSLYGTSLNRNAVHGSDSDKAAVREIEFIKGLA